MSLNTCADVVTTFAADYQTNDNGRQPVVPLQVEGLAVILIVNHVVLSGTVCFLGIVFNVINIVVFLKQGLSNTVNISMFAIAVSDLCSLVTLQWLNINLNPFMENADLPYEPFEIQYLTGGWPHVCFRNITTWITVYVTAERFVCVALPLKVKQIFTPLRTKLVISLIYLLMFVEAMPEYVILYFGEQCSLARNEIRVGLKERNMWNDQQHLMFMLHALVVIVSFICLTVFTSLLVVALKRSSQWREGNSRSFSRRDSKTVKMVCVVSASLIVCNTPGTCFAVTTFIFPGFTNSGKYSNVLNACWSFAFLLQAINSTSTIFFYCKMSTNYRKLVREWFCKYKQPSNSPPQI